MEMGRRLTWAVSLVQSLAIWQALMLCHEGATLGTALAFLVRVALAWVES